MKLNQQLIYNTYVERVIFQNEIFFLSIKFLN